MVPSKALEKHLNTTSRYKVIVCIKLSVVVAVTVDTVNVWWRRVTGRTAEEVRPRGRQVAEEDQRVCRYERAQKEAGLRKD